MNAFYPPRFQLPETLASIDVETAMDKGRFMFVVVIPPRFEINLRAGRHPDIQLNELSVQENVDFMARLFGLSAAQRPIRVAFN